MFARNVRSSWQVGLVASLALLVASSAAAQSLTFAPATGQTPARGAAPAEKLFDNLSLFVGLDGSKSPQDLGINANMGVRFSANWGFPISQRETFGGQVGVAVNLSDSAVHVLDQVEGTSRRSQTYVTAGVFQRMPNNLRWGAAYDFLIQDYYDTVTLGQFRGQVGYGLSDRHEVGAWFTKSAQGADAVVGITGIAVRLDPISQINGYTSHVWPSNARTSLWVGMAAGHNNVVLTVSDEPRTDWVLVYGADLHMPLSERFAVTGIANFLTPTATGTVDAFLGVVFYPGGGASSRSPRAFSPMMSVGNSPMFPVNLRVQ